MTTVRAPLALSLALLLSGTAAAQSQLAFDWRGTTDGPTLTNPPGAITRTVAADFTGEGVLDVFALINGHPVFFASPDAWDTYYTLPNASGINDIAAYPSPAGQAAPLALVNSAGLYKTAINGDGTFQTLQSVSTDALWQGALFVRAAYLDGSSDTQIDFVGVASDQRTIVLLHDGALAHFALPSGYVIYDVMLLNYTGGSALQIAVIDSYGVEVLNVDGSRIKGFARAGSAGKDSFCSFHRGAEARDCIAWATWDPNNPTTYKVLYELHYESNANTSQSTLSSAFSALASGDLAVRVVRADVPAAGGGIDSDLIVNRTQDYRAVHFKNVKPSTGGSAYAATFDSSHYEVINDAALANVPGTSVMPAPLCADFNNDGEPDLILPVEWSSASFFQVWNGRVTNPITGEGNYVSDSSMATASGSTNRLTIYMTLPTAPTTTPPANVLEVTAWSCGSGSPPFTYDNVAHYCYTNADGSIPSTTCAIPIDLALTPGPDAGCFTKMYWFELRWSYWPPTDHTVNARAVSPTYVVAVGAYESALRGLTETGYYVTHCLRVDGTISDTWPCLDSDDSGMDCNSSHSATSVFAPGSITRRRIAPTGDGVPPTPPNPPTARTL